MDIYSDLVSAGLEKIAGDPANQFLGRIYLDTSTDTVKYYGASGVQNITSLYHKIDAIVDPVVTNDSSEGFEKGSIFLNTVKQTFFICADVTVGAAVWKPLDISKNNYEAIIPPSVSDDSSAGFSVGSKWVDTADETIYFCVDSTVGAAVWSKGGAGGVVTQTKLTSPLSVDGVVAELGMTGVMGVGKKYRVIVNARCVRSGVAQNEIQDITFSAVPNEGNFTLTLDGEETSTLWYNAVAADVQAALIALPSVDASGVAVVGDFASGFTVEFINTEGLLDQGAITVTNNTLKSGGTGGVNEVQRFTFSAVPTSGTFTLTYDGNTTAAIAYNAAPATIKAALELLPNIQNVTVTDV